VRLPDITSIRSNSRTRQGGSIYHLGVDKLKHIDYRSLDTIERFSSSDMQRAELIIYEDGKKVVRFNRQLNPPDKLRLIMRWLDSTQFHVKLKKTIDTLHFGTTYQIPRNRD
jgi:hypothetical protein